MIYILTYNASHNLYKSIIRHIVIGTNGHQMMFIVYTVLAVPSILLKVAIVATMYN
jgi:hypothetical protein